MSFQRTRMSADRTLMSVIRTSLSLMAFGFTIAQFFSRLADSGGAPAARSFGTALLLLGVLMLALGILENVRFIVSLRATRIEMTADGLIHGQSAFPPSLVLVTALLLLLVGLIAITSMVFHVGPF